MPTTLPDLQSIPRWFRQTSTFAEMEREATETAEADREQLLTALAELFNERESLSPDREEVDKLRASYEKAQRAAAMAFGKLDVAGKKLAGQYHALEKREGEIRVQLEAACPVEISEALGRLDRLYDELRVTSPISYEGKRGFDPVSERYTPGEVHTNLPDIELRARWIVSTRTRLREMRYERIADLPGAIEKLFATMPAIRHPADIRSATA